MLSRQEEAEKEGKKTGWKKESSVWWCSALPFLKMLWMDAWQKLKSVMGRRKTARNLWTVMVVRRRPAVWPGFSFASQVVSDKGKIRSRCDPCRPRPGSPDEPVLVWVLCRRGGTRGAKVMRENKTLDEKRSLHPLNPTEEWGFPSASSP